MIIAIVVVAAAILGMYFLLNNKEENKDQEGVVKDILKKDAISVAFDDGRVSIVKFFGITLANENEMLDDKILAFFEDSLRGASVVVRAHSIGTGNVMVGEVRTQANEYVNAILVRQGFARWLPIDASADTELAEAQTQAQVDQVGVWNPAVRQLVEEKNRNQGANALTDEEIGNMEVDPDDLESKAGD